MSSTTEMLEFAVSIAEEAGEIALRYFRSPLEVSNKSAELFDPVTQADREIELQLRTRITAAYPDHAIVGEEHGVTDGNHMKWIIDPIDGTRGFITGSPMWGMLIGIMDDNVPVAGVIHQPFLRETFFGSAAGACFKSERGVEVIHTRTTESLAEAVLYTTHPGMFSEGADKKAFAKIDTACLFSRFGGDCYGYALLAAGYADLVVEAALQPYDIIPVIPLIEAAGGVVSDWSGASALDGGRIVAAATPALHRQVIELLNS
ncbi:MAG: histidinol-phosphatase [Gammaproteobacteria bacterium]